MTLAGFSEFITSDQIEMVTINGVEQEFKPLSDNTIALIPTIEQEAQIVKVYCKSSTSGESVQNWTHLPATPPDLSMGFTPAPYNIYRKAT